MYEFEILKHQIKRNKEEKRLKNRLRKTTVRDYDHLTDLLKTVLLNSPRKNSSKQKNDD